MAFQPWQPRTSNPDARQRKHVERAKPHVVEFNLHVSENCDPAGTLYGPTLTGILLAASAAGTRLCEN